jgi:hypothetical protein
MGVERMETIAVAATSAQFLSRFFAGTEGYIEIRAFDQSEKIRRWFNRSPQNIAARIEECLREGLDVYFGCATRDGDGGGKANCKEIVALWADLDCKDISI